MTSLSIFFDSRETAEALKRYCKFNLQIDDIRLFSLRNPYNRKQVYESASKCGILIIDGFCGEEPVGFRFARAMEQRVLLLFYGSEIGSEKAESFFIRLPFDFNHFKTKIKEILSVPPPSIEKYEVLEGKWPGLKERKQQHHHR